MLQDFTGKDKLNVVIKSFNKIWQPAKFAVYVKQNYSLFFSETNNISQSKENSTGHLLCSWFCLLLKNLLTEVITYNGL